MFQTENKYEVKWTPSSNIWPIYPDFNRKKEFPFQIQNSHFAHI